MSGSARDCVGRDIPRFDGHDKVTGATRYVDDLTFEGMWHAATVRCPHAKARIARIDADAALASGDVVVLTAADVPGGNVLTLIAKDWPVLAKDVCQHVGEAVALVAAPTRAAARRAAAAVKVEYELLPPVLGFDAALAGDPRSEEQGPLVLARCAIDHGDAAQGLQAAEHVFEATYETGYQEHIYLEPQGMIALPAGDGLEFIGSLQCPYYVHKAMATLFGLAEGEVRVRQVATGGGFGGKEDYPDMIAAHAGLLARATGRPVKLVYDRNEDIVATTKRHPARVRHRTGVKANGELVAMEIDVLLDGGAYTTLSPVVLSRAVLHAGGAYRCPNVKINGLAVATNTATNGAFRGFGAPQSQYAVERQMDAIGRALGIDPLTLRELNAYRPGDVTPTGQVLDSSVSALECLESVAQRTNFRARWKAIEEQRENGRQDDGSPRPGLGLALFWHGSGFTGNGERNMRSPATIDLQSGGVVRVLVSSADFGQGTEIVLAQIVADAVGIPIDSVAVVQPDTALVPDSGPTVASRTVLIVGRLLQQAGERLAQAICAHTNGAQRVAGGEVLAASGAVLQPFASAADAYLADHGALEITERFEGDASTFDEETYRGTAYACYGWGSNVVEVRVDPDTLAVTPVKLTMAADVGKAIHPTLCAGQVEGGTLQAIAWGYLEEIKLEAGRYLNDRMTTYIIPTSLDVPDMDTVLIENPAASGPFGAKGVGELPMDGGAPAIVAAIENATGIVARDIPATPERLHACLVAGQVLAGSEVLEATK